MQEPSIITTEETPDEILKKQNATKKLKRKVNKYRTISAFSTLIFFTVLWILCSNVSVIEVLILSLPLLGTAVFGYLAAEDTLKEKSKGRNLLQVVLTFLIALGIGFATKSSSNQQSLNTRAERDSLQKVSDFTISRKVTDSVKRIYDGISSSFAEQGLKLDSLNYAVSQFRDSAKTNIINNNPERPVLTIPADGIVLKRHERFVQMLIMLKSENASSEVQSMKYAWVVIDSFDKRYIVKTEPGVFDSQIISKDKMIVQTFTALNISNVKNIEFGIEGSYLSLTPDRSKYSLKKIYTLAGDTTSYYIGPKNINWFKEYGRFLD